MERAEGSGDREVRGGCGWEEPGPSQEGAEGTNAQAYVHRQGQMDYFLLEKNKSKDKSLHKADHCLAAMEHICAVYGARTHVSPGTEQMPVPERNRYSCIALCFTILESSVASLSRLASTLPLSYIPSFSLKSLLS